VFAGLAQPVLLLDVGREAGAGERVEDARGPRRLAENVQILGIAPDAAVVVRGEGAGDAEAALRIAEHAERGFEDRPGTGIEGPLHADGNVHTECRVYMATRPSRRGPREPVAAGTLPGCANSVSLAKIAKAIASLASGSIPTAAVERTGVGANR